MNSWYVEISDDGSTWTKIDERTGQMRSEAGYDSYNYKPSLPVVISSSETLKSMNVLRVLAGEPVAFSSPTEYDEIYLADKLTLNPGSTLLCPRIVIDVPFESQNGGRWLLEAVGGMDIVIGPPGMQRFSWLQGNGTVATHGAGKLIIGDKEGGAYIGTAYMNATTTADDWQHAGMFMLSNSVSVVCRANDCLPFGANTGRLEFWWDNRGLPEPKLDLNGQSVSVNGIDSFHSVGTGVINTSASAATLKLGADDVSGSVSNTVFSGGNINLRKVGTGTAEIAVDAGTLEIRGAANDALNGGALTVAAGATLVVVGQVLRVTSIANAGTISKVNGGRQPLGHPQHVRRPDLQRRGVERQVHALLESPDDHLPPGRREEPRQQGGLGSVQRPALRALQLRAGRRQAARRGRTAGLRRHLRERELRALEALRERRDDYLPLDLRRRRHHDPARGHHADLQIIMI